MNFGMSTACFFPHIYNEDAISLIGSLGVKNIELFFSCLSEYEKPFVAEMKNRADDAGVHIGSVHAFSIQFEGQLFSSHERARQEAMDIYQRVLDAGAALGAQVYVFHGPPNLKRARPLTLDYTYVAERTEPLALAALQRGIRLAWENVHWCWYSSPDFPQKLLPLMPSDSLYFTLDIKQAAQAGYDPADYIAQMQGHLVNVHICDIRHDKEAGIVPALPFEGSLDFARLRDALAAIRYNGPMTLEVYSHNFSNNIQLLEVFNRINFFFSSFNY